MEGAKLDHLAEYLAHARETYVPPLVRLPGEELLVRLGGDGTPEVREFTVCEVAAALGLSQPAATGLCADVLDLTYRLPRIAGCVRSGELPLARARMIARRTRELSVQECALVEARLTRLRDTGRGPVPVAALVPIGRLRAIVDQAVVTVRGPQTEAEAEAQVAASLFVDVVHEVGGATDLAARMASADAARLDRRLDEVASWITQLGDRRPKAVLRAVALGLLADPDLLAALAHLRDERASASPPADVAGKSVEPVLGDVAGKSAEPVLGESDPVAPAPTPPARLPAAGVAGLPAGVLEKLARLRSTVLYVHMDRASGTWCEENAGVLTKEQARQIVGHSHVTVRPVLDLAEPLTYTGYEAPPKLKEQLALLNSGYCTFPHCSRRARPSDVDHQRPYGTGGRTASANTHRLCRKHHRVKDKGDWRVVSPAPGFWIWCSPAGGVWLVTNGTTTPLNGIFVRPTSALQDGGRGHGGAAAPWSGDGGEDLGGSPGSGGTPPRWPGSSGPAGPKSAGLPTGYPLAPDEYDVTYGFIDTG